MSTDPRRIRFAGLGGEVTDRLRDDILAGRYQTGDHLTERELAEEFGLSRGPIRDALRQLDNEGLVQLLPRRGARVASLSSTEAAQVIEIRQALEPVAIRFLLEQNDPDRLKPLEEILDRLRKAGQEDDWANLVAIDMEFHEAVYQLAGSPMLLRLWDTLRVPLLQTFRMHRQFYEAGPDVYETHRRLFDAIVSGDAVAAEAAAREHVVDLRGHLMNHLASEPQEP